MQAHPTPRQAIRAGAMARAARAQWASAAPMPWPRSRADRGTEAVAERKAKGRLGRPVSHPEHGDTPKMLPSDTFRGRNGLRRLAITSAAKSAVSATNPIRRPPDLGEANACNRWYCSRPSSAAECPLMADSGHRSHAPFEAWVHTGAAVRIGPPRAGHEGGRHSLGWWAGVGGRGSPGHAGFEVRVTHRRRASP